jgi:hypothetical protein
MRQDNAGENKKLEKRLQSADWKLPIKMECTTANAPQQNALVEVKFTYLAAKVEGQSCMLLKCLGCPKPFTGIEEH